MAYLGFFYVFIFHNTKIVFLVVDTTINCINLIKSCCLFIILLFIFYLWLLFMTYLWLLFIVLIYNSYL